MQIEFMRALIGFGVALLVALVVGRPFLYALRRLGLGQHIRAEGPKSHQQKAGTPTMGGVIILTALCVTLFALGLMRGPVAWAFLLTLGFGLLGLLDDLLSITRGRNMGLKARQKLLGEIVLGGLLALYAVQHGFGADLPVPFLVVKVSLGKVLFFLLVVFATTSMTNAVNLTDGLDGLAAGTVAVAALSQAALSIFLGQPAMAVFAAVIAGSCLGFLWLNAHPAAVFMGDTGSLALGAALTAAAVFSKSTFFLPITAGVTVLETVSVVLQVLIFQTMHRRVLRMSPLHHHFELGGLAEEKVVARFWLAGAVCGVVGLLGLIPLLAYKVI